jgi:hypothetical protein
MSNQESEAVLELIDTLLSSKSYPDEIHQCPECGGQLHVRFEVYTRGKKRMLGVQAECKNCDVAIAADYGEPLPPWMGKNDSKI